MKKLFLLFFTSFLIASVSYAADKYAHSAINWSSGPWYDAASGGNIVGAPADGDNVFTNGFVVTVDVDAYCNNLTLTSLTNAITVSTGITLTISGLLDCGATVNNDVIGGTGTVKLTGSGIVIGPNWTASAVFDKLVFDPGIGNTASFSKKIKFVTSLVVNSGTVTNTASSLEIYSNTSATGDIIIATGATLDLSSNTCSIHAGSSSSTLLNSVTINGTLKTKSTIAANLLTVNNGGYLNISTSTSPGTITTPTFNTGSTVEYSGGAITILDVNYGNLKISGSSTKTWTETATRTVDGNLTMSGTSTLSVNYNTNVNGNINLTGSNTFSLSAGLTVTVKGNIDVGTGSVLNPGSSNARFVASGLNRTLTLNGTAQARVTSNYTQTPTSTSAFEYQYNGFSSYVFSPTSWLSFRDPAPSLAVTFKFDKLSTNQPYANVEFAVVATGTKDITVQFQNDMTFSGNLAFPRLSGVTGTITMDFQSYNIKIGGNIQLNGSNSNSLSGGRTYTMGTSTFEFNGSGAQTIGGTDLPSAFANLVINNSNGVNLNTPVSVSNTLTISNGGLTTGSNILTLGPSATLTESAGKFVLGNLQTTRNIGSGVSSDFGGAGITLGAAAEDLGNVTLTRVTGSPVTLNSKNSISRVWKLNPTNPLTVSRDMMLSWLSDDDNSLTLNNVLTWQSTDDFATIDNVAPLGPSGDASTTRSLTVTLSALTSSANTSFTVFQADSPLPVELSAFVSTVKNNAVTLSWSTATEKSNYGFNVERSADKTNWVKIGFVNGSGNSNSVKNYSFTDKSANSGKMYYRLKQVDTDGKYEYSKIIEADLGLPKAYELSNNYPNPFNPSTTIRFSLPEKQNVKITIFNTLGQKVAEILNGEMEAGVHEVNFNASNLTSGIYIYRMDAGKFTQTKKMMLVK
jgi:hypothetical protein